MDISLALVGWESQTDPDMPFNFTRWQKWTWVFLLSLMTLLTPLATSILSPAIDRLETDFGETDSTFGSMTVSIFLAGYVVGPVFIGPLSEIYGRKIVLSVANLFFCFWQVGYALAPNITILIVSRFFSGVGGAACLTLGGSIIGDLFRPYERGFAMGIWNLGPLLGPVVGPLLGGFLAQYLDWRWDFWIVLAAALPTTIAISFCTREICHKVLIQNKTDRLRKDLDRPDLKNCYAGTANHQAGPIRVICTSLLRPMKLLACSPTVSLLSLYIAFIFGLVYLLYTTIPTVFQTRYHFSTGETGYPYISLGIGNALAWLAFTAFSDKVVVRLSTSNDGVFVPETRLVMAIPFGILLPISLVWYGWSAYFDLHWACTIAALLPFGVGIVGLFLPISTYIVDCYPEYAASATAANVIVRSIVGALLPLAGPSLYATLDLGWGNTLLGLLSAIMVPLPLVLYKVGGRLRMIQRSVI